MTAGGSEGTGAGAAAAREGGGAADDRAGLWAGLVAIGLVGLLAGTFQPRWETNDDLVMAMTAHGFGTMARGSPLLVFSNAIWGWIVRAVPTVGGVLGYAAATMAILALAAGLVTRALGRSRSGFALGSLAAAVILFRAIVFPQFTMTAGFLAVAAVAALRRAVERRERGLLLLSLLAAWLAFLVRAEECGLVLFLALPLLPWTDLRRQRWTQAALAGWVGAVLLATLADRAAYRGEAWAHFREVNAARLPIIDYGGWERLRSRPDILARHGYTANDLNLVRNWFFVDPAVADPAVLTAMQRELGPRPVAVTLKLAGDALVAVASPRLWPLAAAGLGLALLAGTRRVGTVWLLALVAIAAMGMAGRPAILRVYEPVLGLLVIGSLLDLPRRGWRPWAAAGLVAVSGGSIGILLMKEQAVSQAGVATVQAGLKRAGLDRALIWGGDFKLELAYPVLGGAGTPWDLKFDSFDAFVLAPGSNMATAERSGDGVIGRLLSGRTVNLLSSTGHNSDVKIGLLRSYLRQRHHRDLRVRRIVVSRLVVVDELSSDPLPEPRRKSKPAGDS